MASKQSKKPLTAIVIKGMKPKNPDKSDVGENRGLRVTCGAGGTKTFFYRYKSPLTEKLTQIKIGNFSTVSLSEARAKLQELKQARKEGRCPATEKKEKQARDLCQEGKQILTVKELVDLYLTQHIEDREAPSGKTIKGVRQPKGQSEVRRSLYSDVVNTLGNSFAKDITRNIVVDMVVKIVNRGANVQAGNVLRELCSAYEFAIGRGKFEDEFANPALLAKASLNQAKYKLSSKSGTRVLSEPELVKLLKWLPGSAYTTTQKNVLRFALWTGCRTGEVCSAMWSDVDLGKGVFCIQETKTGASRDVQLSRQTIEFLKSLKLSTGDCLFPSIKTRKPIQQKQLTEQAWRLRSDGRMLDIPPWTPHDLRRTVRTGLSKLQCPSEVAEAVLGHARKGVQGTYDLHRYEEECKSWLQIWADHLDEILCSEGSL